MFMNGCFNDNNSKNEYVFFIQTLMYKPVLIEPLAFLLSSFFRVDVLSPPSRRFKGGTAFLYPLWVGQWCCLFLLSPLSMELTFPPFFWVVLFPWCCCPPSTFWVAQRSSTSFGWRYRSSYVEQKIEKKKGAAT